MPIIEPSDAAYEPEWRLRFRAMEPPEYHDVIILSGVVNTGTIKGTSDDSFEHYDVHLVVGPFWHAVNEVVPFVTVSAFDNTDADEDDEQGWNLERLTWDALSGPPGPAEDEERIRLNFVVRIKGENSRAPILSYHVTARGSLGQLRFLTVDFIPFTAGRSIACGFFPARCQYEVKCQLL